MIQEPLVYFLALGALLFLVNTWRSPPPPPDERLIRVDEADLVLFVRHRYGKFGAGESEAFLSSLDAEARQRVVDDFVREEIYYREARDLKLDRVDYSIRQRLATQFETMEQGMIRDSMALSADDIRAFYDNHHELYESPALVTFSTSSVTADGDHAVIHPYRRMSSDDVEEMFGKAFARRLSSLPVEPDAWIGPIESEAGKLEVRLESRIAPVLPAFEDVADMVSTDATTDFLQRGARRQYDLLRAKYKVELVTGAEAEDAQP